MSDPPEMASHDRYLRRPTSGAHTFRTSAKDGRRDALVVTGLTGLAAPWAAGPAAADATAVTVAGSPTSLTTGRGATVAFLEHEAENAVTNGTVLAESFKANTLAGEASGRRAVQIGAGQYVGFTLSAPANSIVVRASVPDGANGDLVVSAPGLSARNLAVTSKYGWYYGSYPFTNTPSSVNPHHFYDESRMLFGHDASGGHRRPRRRRQRHADVHRRPRRLRAGRGADRAPRRLAVRGRLRRRPDRCGGLLQRLRRRGGSGSQPGSSGVDPAGTFTITRHIIVDNVTLRGAGPWYSVLHGNRVGVYGNYAPNVGRNVQLHDFAIIGEVRERNDSDQVNAVGAAMTNSAISNIWTQHVEVGMWMDGPFDNLQARNLRILDTTADGVNFHNGVTNSSVTNSFLRNSGDDGLAMWAEVNQEVRNSFTNNTVILPILANNSTIYGGQDITVSGNVVSDTLGRLHVLTDARDGPGRRPAFRQPAQRPPGGGHLHGGEQHDAAGRQHGPELAVRRRGHLVRRP